MNEDCDGGKYPVKVEISELGNTINTTIVNTDLIKEIHECQFCDKTYPTKTQLSRHLREKHGVKTYKKHIKLFPSEIKNLMSSSVAIKVEPSIDNVTNEDLEVENTKITSITNTDPFGDTFTVNPWQVESIEAFAYLKCPECVFDCKEEVIFQNHALKNHPLSFVLFDVKSKFKDIKVKKELSEENWDNGFIKEEISEYDDPQYTSVGIVGSMDFDSNMPYSCKICQISFQKKRDQRTHITVFQSGKRYMRCCACDVKFSWGNFRHLKSHISAVHEGKSCRCNFCGECFTEKEELEEHEASVHVNAIKKLSLFCQRL